MHAEVFPSWELSHNIKPVLSHLRPTSTGYGTFFELGKAISGLIAVARKVFGHCLACTYIV